MRKIRSPRTALGFTMIELMLVLSLMLILALFTYPTLIRYIHKSKLVSTARQATSMMSLSRFEAVKRNRPVRVEADFLSDRMIAFADLNANGTFEEATDKLVTRFALPVDVDFWGPADSAPEGADAVSNFSKDATKAWVVYQPDGSIERTGAFRFGDRVGNFLEVRVQEIAGARTRLLKWDTVVLPNAWVAEGTAGKAWVFK
ncbi:MAG TPA: GspH/FimT family pseudopilin [Thermoanaerobaculia bacterium]|jgi:prepilin-type N-terminal cleavage/methylation domain-containing protein|nr:GspH/FimT family pseudopilin [Thermoanaerobaculia bacterium]